VCKIARVGVVAQERRASSADQGHVISSEALAAQEQKKGLYRSIDQRELELIHKIIGMGGAGWDALPV
jgi:hypothetical protein